MEKRKLSRREFLRLGLVGGALSTVSSRFGGRTVWQGSAEMEDSQTKLAPYALIIDVNRCTGCGACVQACQLENDLPEGVSYIHVLPRGDNHVRWYLPVQCQHCAVPLCNRSCPTGAAYRCEDDFVLLDEALCVGCKACIYACPYQARVFDEERGICDKCCLCLDRLSSGGTPACVEACILGARVFGQTADPNSKVSRLIKAGEALVLHPEFSTKPAVLRYVPFDPAVRLRQPLPPLV